MRISSDDVNFGIRIVKYDWVVTLTSRLLSYCLVGLLVSSLSTFSFIKRFHRLTEVTSTPSPIVG